jgi:hypothetical protein
VNVNGIVNLLLLTATTASVSPSVFASGRTEAEFDVHWQHKSQSIVIRIRSQKFREAAHEISLRKGWKYVDGQRALGIDGTGEIETEIAEFEIFWNGEKVPLPKEAYAPLFNFSLNKARYFPGDSGELLAVKSDTTDALLFVFATGAENVRQWVWLLVKRDGKWTRFTGSDGDSPL